MPPMPHTKVKSVIDVRSFSLLQLALTCKMNATTSEATREPTASDSTERTSHHDSNPRRESRLHHSRERKKQQCTVETAEEREARLVTWRLCDKVQMLHDDDTFWMMVHNRVYLH